MVRVSRRTAQGRTYLYLEHSYREGGEVRKKEVYLGRSLPSDIEARKKAFLSDIYRAKWHPLLEEIRLGFAKDRRRTPATARDRNLAAFGVQFTYDTQRIEGSTLTLRETADLLERGLTPARPLRDVREAEAHIGVFRGMLRERRDLSLGLVLRWHRDLFRGTRPDIAGRIREHSVAISGSRFTPPMPVELQPLLRDFFREYARERSRMHPVELAALVHLRLATIHPFSDGNGRVARLLTNFVLHRHGCPMVNIPYAGRGAYYTALERAQTKRMDRVFVRWLLRRYVKEHRRYLRPE